METAGGELPRRRSREEEEEEAAAAAAAAASMTCPVCKRTFSSTKAMHGHLRTHPERNYRGTNPNSRPKPSKTKAPAAGDGSRQPVAISANIVVVATERERSQSTRIPKRTMVKETTVDTEGGGCSTSSSAAAPPRKYERFSSRSKSGISISDGAIKISPLAAAAEAAMLSEEEWIAVDALKQLRESSVSTPTVAATHPPFTFDLNQPPPPADQKEETN